VINNIENRKISLNFLISSILLKHFKCYDAKLQHYQIILLILIKLKLNFHNFKYYTFNLTTNKENNMKKLLATSALTCVAMLSSVTLSSAQTTVSGNLALGYKAQSTKTPSTTDGKIQSYRTFVKESQINLANKGKLNNGMDYAAGFSLEFDGNQGATGLTPASTNDSISAGTSENVYLNFISGATTLHFGADHIQNPDTMITNIAGGLVDLDEVMSGVNAKAPIFITTANSAYQAYGAGIVHNFGPITASIYHTPSRANGLAANNGGNRGSNDVDGAVNAGADTSESQTEVMLRGDLGVKGLTALAYYGTADSGSTTLTDKTTGLKVGARYNFGAITVAGDFAETETGAGAVTTVKTESRSIGLAYAVNKDVTVGLMHARSERNTLPGFTEKLTGINIGYNLGPVAVNAHIAKGDDVGGTASEGKAAMIHANVAF
jgi:hypothetical protein